MTQYAYLVSVLTLLWSSSRRKALTVNHMACRKNYEAFSTSASLTACKQITNKTGCHRAGGHGTSARALNRNARSSKIGASASDARLSRHFVN